VLLDQPLGGNQSMAKTFGKSLAFMLTLVLLTLPCWAGERVTTDGKSKDSPIRVDDLYFQDSGYGLPSPQAEIRMSVHIRNSSKEDDVKNVLIKLELKNLDGEVVQKWEKMIPVMKKGAVVEFDPGGVYYNYSFNNVQPAVVIEHDEIEKKDADKKADKDNQ